MWIGRLFLAGFSMLACVGAAYAGGALAAERPETLRCAVALRSAADDLRGAQGDSADVRALTLSASKAEETYRRAAEADGLDPLQIEIAIAAERDAGGDKNRDVSRCLRLTMAANTR